MNKCGEFVELGLRETSAEAAVPTQGLVQADFDQGAGLVSWLLSL